MTWCRQATSHYLNQCCPSSVTSHGVTRPHCVKMFAGIVIPIVKISRSRDISPWICFIQLIFKLNWNYWLSHDDVIKWKHFLRYWPFVRGIHRSRWRGALMFSFIDVWINDWVNNREAGDLRRQRGHYDVIVMESKLYRWFCEFMYVWAMELYLIETAHLK